MTWELAGGSAPPADFDYLQPRLPWSLVVAFWTAFWLSYIAIQTGAHFLDPVHRDLPSAARITEEFVEAGLWMFLTPIILRLGASLPVNWQNAHRRLPLHVTIAVAGAAVYGYASFAVHNTIAHVPAEQHQWDFRTMTAYVLDTQYRFYLFFFFAILVAGFALRAVGDLHHQHVASAQMHAQLSETRLRALRMQLHPHFIFNSLNLVANLTERDPREARRVIARLGELLRRALDSADEQEVSLRDELYFARIYAEIVHSRFGDRVRVEFKVHPRLEDALVPNLILQPLLENAVEHGCGEMQQGGYIEVTAELREETLILGVRDNGPGTRNGSIEDGIGLGNTRARLEQLYGDRAGVHIREPSEGGMLINIRLPYRSSLDSPRKGLAIRTRGGTT